MMPTLSTFRYQAQDAFVRDTVLEETDDPRVGHGIVKALDIRIEHPVQAGEDPPDDFCHSTKTGRLREHLSR
jgi:hypothetical protein